MFFAGFLLAGAPRCLVPACGAPLWAVLAALRPCGLAAFAIGGFGAGFLNPVLGAVAFERVPPRLLGRGRPPDRVPDQAPDRAPHRIRGPVAERERAA